MKKFDISFYYFQFLKL